MSFGQVRFYWTGAGKDKGPRDAQAFVCVA